MSNNNMQFKGKIKKGDFENKLSEIADGRELSARRTTENGQALTLYYISEAHAGTWTSGTGWIFSEERIERNIESMAKITRELGA